MNKVNRLPNSTMESTSTVRTLSFIVDERGQQQGSMRAVGRGKFTQLISMNKNLHAFRKLVGNIAWQKMNDEGFVWFAKHEPVEVALVFNFIRPKSVKRKQMVVAPDIDKLARGILDSFKNILWADCHTIAWASVHYRVKCLIDYPKIRHNNSMAGKGGKTPGAGRKPSTIKGILRNLPKDTAALILAEIDAGKKWVSLAHSEDEAIVFKTLAYLTDRAFGKAKQAVEVTGEEGGPIKTSLTVTFIK